MSPRACDDHKRLTSLKSRVEYKPFGGRSGVVQRPNYSNVSDISLNLMEFCTQNGFFDVMKFGHSE